MTQVQESTVRAPRIGGAVTFLLTTMPLGVFWFVFTTVVLAAGIPMTIIWIGLPVLMLGLVTWRGGATLERARVRALLGRYVAAPYRALPTGLMPRMKARFTDPATWRDVVYLVLLFPIGVFWFALFVALWSLGLGLSTLWIWFRFLPNGETQLFDIGDGPTVLINSTLDALPWALAGLLILAAAALLSRAAGRLHGKFAQAMLGPSRGFLHTAEQQHQQFDAPVTYPGS